MRHNWRALFLGVLSAPTILLGCATTPGMGRTALPITYAPEAGPPERYLEAAALREAFETYWAKRLAGQWEEAWAMEAPYFQEMASKRLYAILHKNSNKKTLLALTIKRADKQDQLLEIPLQFVFDKKERGGEDKVFVTDRWVHAGGKWYHVMRDPVLFPGL